MGIDLDEERVYTTEDLAPGENIVFPAPPASRTGNSSQACASSVAVARTRSLVMTYQAAQVRFVDTVEMYDRDRPPKVRL